MPTEFNTWVPISATNIVRDVELELYALLIRYPTLGRFITLGGEPAKNHIHEWPEYSQQQATTTMGANLPSHAANGTGITLTVADTSFLLVGDQLFVEQADPQYVITNIGGPTTLTVSEIRGFASAGGFGNGYVVKFNRGFVETSGYGSTFSGLELPTLKQNYTQIFRENFEVSTSLQATSAAGMLYGYDQAALDVTINQTLNRIMWQVNNAVMYGVAAQRTSTSTSGYMRGVRNFIDDITLYTGSTPPPNVIPASGALTLPYLNQATAEIYEFMNMTDQLVMLMSPQQARVVSTFAYNSNSSALRVETPDGKNDNLTAGNNTSYFVPNTPGLGQIPVVIDKNMPRDEVWFVDPTYIRLVPLITEPLRCFLEKVPGKTAWSGYVTGQYTLVFRQPLYRSAMIKGLSIPSGP